MVKTRVFFVDDDPMLLSSTRRQLMNKLTNCELAFFDQPTDALANIESVVPDIVFSDMRMPQMDGAEFLRQVAQAHPETVRLAWTGQSESDQLERAFHVSHQVLSKPCPTERLQQIIESIAEYRGPIRNSNLLEQLTHPEQNRFNLSRLKELLTLLDDPDTSAQAIAKQIDESPLARARLLGIVNSSFFSPSVTVSETIQAVMMLGFGMVKAVILAAQVSTLSQQVPFVNAEIKRCLDNGTDLAVRVRALASEKKLNEDDTNSALITAMFHEFGRIQFAIHGGREYAKQKSQSDGQPAELEAIETELFGVQQHRVAAYLLTVWGMDTYGCKMISQLYDTNDGDPVLAVLQDAMAERENT